MNMTNTKDRNFVIVGASLAGAQAARTLREEGFDERVVLIGAEPHPSYERPPLSKDYLRGETLREKTYVHPQTFYADNEIELLTSTTVREIDAWASEVVLDGGRRTPLARHRGLRRHCRAEARVVASANVHTHEHAHGHGEHDDHHGHDHGDHGHASAGDGVGSIEALIRSRARVDVRRLTDPDEGFEGLTHVASQAS
jgi:flavin-dependent dehydrogenase